MKIPRNAELNSKESYKRKEDCIACRESQFFPTPFLFSENQTKTLYLTGKFNFSNCVTALGARKVINVPEMPTHWESSKRPLFVRTVLVNGSRHAILTHEDSLGQSLVTANKNSGPDSPRSIQSSSESSTGQSVDNNVFKKSPKEKG